MPKPEEKEKAENRGQTLTPAEEALEDARDAFHTGEKSQADKDAFHAAQQAVVAERQSSRQAREAAGPPATATDIQRDGAGRITGWNEPGGGVTIAQGGVDG
jgi:hypothetical protein